MHATKIPVVLKTCIEEVERRGLDFEGLYRVSGKSNDLLKIKKIFDSEGYADLTGIEDIHAITGALKLYLRELPLPLMTFEAYEICLIAAKLSTPEERMDMLKVGIQHLPPSHYNTLKYLIRHLHKVTEHRKENRMDATNLAVVFAPSIMRSPYGSGIMAVQKLPEQKKAIELLISQCSIFFP
eukprot:Em0020g98a